MNESQIILVYYKFRGQLQPIRNLLCYLDLPFFEVHLELMDQKSAWPNAIKEQLKGVRIDKNRVPTLIYQNYTVSQPYPILNFICYRFGREDFLGTNPQEKARLQQILQVYFQKQPNSMTRLWQISDLGYSKDTQEMQMILNKSYETVMNRSGYIREICQHLDSQLNPKYILSSQITIADFLFLETCNYMLGVFCECGPYKEQKNLLEKERRDQLNFVEEGERTGRRPNIQYLKVMKDFKQRMEKHQFYQKYSHYLESFSIISFTTTPERIQGLRKIWKLKDFFVR